jgi:YgiT-type zinc finger domain-containing protein
MKSANFWQDETCEYCDGRIVEKRVTLYRKVKCEHVVIENVPAGVCTECGTRYFAANVLKIVEEDIHGKRNAERKVIVPVYAF